MKASKNWKGKKALIIGIVIIVIIIAGTLTWLYLAPRKAVAVAIATGGTGGTWYVIGSAQAAVISKYVPGVEAAAEVTAASIDNLKLMQEEKVALAWFTGDTTYECFNNIGFAEQFGTVPEEAYILCLAPQYPSQTHIVTLKEKDINTIYDLKGKRVSIGAPGSQTELMIRRILACANITPEEDFAAVEHLGARKSAEALLDGKIDAFIFNAGPPTAAVLELASKASIKLIPIPEEIRNEMLTKYPGYVPAVFKPGIYPGVEEEIPTLGYWCFMVVNSKLVSEDIVYKIIKAWDEHIDEIKASHSAVPEWWNTSSWCPKWTIKYGRWHPAAVQYYQEKGVWPESAVTITATSHLQLDLGAFELNLWTNIAIKDRKFLIPYNYFFIFSIF